MATTHANGMNGIAQPDEKVYFDSLTEAEVRPLWVVMKKLNAAYPETKCTPFVWEWSKMRPLIQQAGDVVPIHLAERRVLQLINARLLDERDNRFLKILQPGRAQDGYTLDTLYAGIQSVKPYEVAPAHRHTAFALRFIIEGERGYTNVEGKRFYMKRGDVILTPSWHWHDHGSKSDQTMIWLDGLNLPLFQSFPFNFTEQYEKAEFPAADVDQHESKFPWSEMSARLMAAKSSYIEYEYLLPGNQPVGKTISGNAARLNAGTQSPPRHETTNFVFHCIEGKGSTVIRKLESGKEHTLKWQRGDTFCVPSWHWFQHQAEPGEDVFLFFFTDKPMLDKLGWWRSSI